MAASDYIAVVAPAYVGDSRLDMAITMATQEAPTAICAPTGAAWEIAIAHLAAHILAMSDRSSAGGSGAVGSLKNITTGALSEGYGSAGSWTLNTGSASLSQTPNGLEYLRIVMSWECAVPQWLL